MCGGPPAAVWAASSRIVVAPLGKVRMRGSSASKMPSSRNTRAKWMPAVARAGSGKYTASAASSAACKACGVDTSGRAAPAGTAMPVRTRPSALRVWPRRRPAATSSPTILSVTINRSQGSPASSASCIAPTAPKRATRVAPVSACNSGIRALTRPWAAPAHSRWRDAVTGLLSGWIGERSTNGGATSPYSALAPDILTIRAHLAMSALR